MSQISPLDNLYVIKEILLNQRRVCSSTYGKFQPGVSQLGLRLFRYKKAFKYRKAVHQAHDYREKAAQYPTAGLHIDYSKI